MSIALLDSSADGFHIGSHRPSEAYFSGVRTELLPSINEFSGDAAGGVHSQLNAIQTNQATGRANKQTASQMMHRRRRPEFDELPLRSASDPKASAWGLYGADDELGTLNLLTPEVRREAWSENKLGFSISLSLPLNLPRVPMNPRRKPIEHHILGKGYANDDELVINTQSSSHWDGLRHYPYQNLDELKFYNGALQSDIIGPMANERIGVQNLAKYGIAGRAVLLDWRSYALQQKISYSPFEAHGIPLSELLEVAKIQGSKFKHGDILLIRTGWTEEYLKLSIEEQIELARRSVRSSVGVQASYEMLKWHWDMAFSAVASDTNAYEAWPSPRPWGVSCHEVFLSGWGMPIGEVWDLEALAAKCAEIGRWEFFLSSAPLNLPAGVASPSNALALL